MPWPSGARAVHRSSVDGPSQPAGQRLRAAVDLVALGDQSAATKTPASIHVPHPMVSRSTGRAATQRAICHCHPVCCDGKYSQPAARTSRGGGAAGRSLIAPYAAAAWRRPSSRSARTHTRRTATAGAPSKRRTHRPRGSENNVNLRRRRTTPRTHPRPRCRCPAVVDRPRGRLSG